MADCASAAPGRKQWPPVRALSRVQLYWGPAIVSGVFSLLLPSSFRFSPCRSFSAFQSSLAVLWRRRHPVKRRATVIPQLFQWRRMGPTVRLPFLIWVSELGSLELPCLQAAEPSCSHKECSGHRPSGFPASLGRVVRPAGLGRPAGNRSGERWWLPARERWQR